MRTTVVVSLDFDTEREATSLVECLGSSATAYKVGLQTLTVAGPQLVRKLVANGKEVFLDLKLHEIPNSVAGAVRAAGNLGVSLVRRLASLATSAGCHGVVASVREASFLRASLPNSALIVCPGIQLPESGDTDQVRVATPAAAVRAGATHIVVGRAIAAAANPVAAYEEIVRACDMRDED